MALIQADPIVETKTIAYVRVEHKHSHDGTYDYTIASTSLPVDITDLEPVEADKKLADALDKVKAVVFDSLGVDYAFDEAGNLQPVIQPAVPVVKQGNASKFPPKVQTVPPPVSGADVIRGAFGGGTSSFIVMNPETNEPSGATLPSWAVEALSKDFAGKQNVWVYDHSNHPNDKHPRYKVSKKTAEAAGVSGGYWPPK